MLLIKYPVVLWSNGSLGQWVKSTFLGYTATVPEEVDRAHGRKLPKPH
jgi:hypothetical protein